MTYSFGSGVFTIDDRQIPVSGIGLDVETAMEQFREQVAGAVCLSVGRIKVKVEQTPEAEAQLLAYLNTCSQPWRELLNVINSKLAPGFMGLYRRMKKIRRTKFAMRSR